MRRFQIKKKDANEIYQMSRVGSRGRHRVKTLGTSRDFLKCM